MTLPMVVVSLLATASTKSDKSAVGGDVDQSKLELLGSARLFRLVVMTLPDAMLTTQREPEKRGLGLVERAQGSTPVTVENMYGGTNYSDGMKVRIHSGGVKKAIIQFEKAESIGRQIR